MALYALCDSDAATIFDHGKGHAVPRESQTIEELAAVVDEMLAQVT
jgi:hypothetical protein